MLIIGHVEKVSTSFWDMDMATSFKQRDERAASPFNRVPSADAFGFNANCRKSTSTRAAPIHLELIGNEEPINRFSKTHHSTHRDLID